MKKDIIIWVAMRFALGCMFLWAFVDKLFGWGFATKPNQAWLAGGSPTSGFLNNAVHGPFKEFFNSLAGKPIVDWLFMLALLGIGLAILLGIALKIAGWSGAVLMILMWLSLLPPTNHPFLDEHIVYALLFIGFAVSNLKPGRYWGLGKWWSNTWVVRKYSFLE